MWLCKPGSMVEQTKWCPVEHIMSINSHVFYKTPKESDVQVINHFVRAQNLSVTIRKEHMCRVSENIQLRKESSQESE